MTTTDENSDEQRPSGGRASALPCLVTLTEIADLLAPASTNPQAVVSNWRKRYASFPPPVTIGRSPLFDARDIFEWAASADSPLDPDDARERIPGPTWWWSKTAEALRTSEPTAGRSILAAIVLLRSAALGDLGVPGDPDRWRELVASGGASDLGAFTAHIEDLDDRFAGLLVAPLAPLAERGDRLSVLVERLDAAGGVASGPELLEAALGGGEAMDRSLRFLTTTADDLARLMVGLALETQGGERRPIRTVLDPVCGEGRLLVEAVRAVRTPETSADAVASETVGPQVFGQDVDESSWRIARTALLLERVDADLGVAGLDSIEEDQWRDVRADLVVVDPPMPAGRRSDSGDLAHDMLDWVLYATTHTSDQGRSAVLVPAFTLATVESSRRKPDKGLSRLVSSLASRGHVELVAVLPRRLRSDIPGPLTIWVFRAEPQIQPVLLVEAWAGHPIAPRAREDRELPFDVDAMIEISRQAQSRDPESMRSMGRPVRIAAIEPDGLLGALSEAVDRVEEATSNPKKPRRSPGDDAAELRAELRRAHERIRDLEQGVSDLMAALEPELPILWRENRPAWERIQERLDHLRDD